MNDDVIDDLKQFITATITQQSSDIRGDISGIHGEISGIHGKISGIRGDISDLRQDVTSLRKDVARVDTKVDDLAAFMAEAMDNYDQSTSKQLTDHDRRITKLESKTS